LNGELYPFVQRVGHLNLIAVNSSTGNRMAWDASGAVGPLQRDRLRQLLSTLEPGPRILVTHYPICHDNGHREHRAHGLRDLTEMVQVAAEGGVNLWIHGHRHQPYVLQEPPLAPFPVICVGSATQTGRWSYNEYAIEGNQCRVQRRIFNAEKGTFQDGTTFEIQLAGAVPNTSENEPRIAPISTD